VSDALVVERLSKSFGSHLVLRDIDVTVAEHEVVALIGASGSGKSTLLRCINLLEPLDAGRIFLGGEEITHPRDVNAVRRRIGIVFQSYNLFPHMSVLRNVTLAPHDARRRSSTGSGSPTSATTTPTASPAGSSSASRSCARSQCSPR